ncbi:hypothetical protein HFN89_06520 [Rhizobium laguerreae]|nr:hypothetical protein [Rhizobium laguerreae]
MAELIAATVPPMTNAISVLTLGVHPDSLPLEYWSIASAVVNDLAGMALKAAPADIGDVTA